MFESFLLERFYENGAKIPIVLKDWIILAKREPY